MEGFGRGEHSHQFELRIGPHPLRGVHAVPGLVVRLPRVAPEGHPRGLRSRAVLRRHHLRPRFQGCVDG